MGRSSRRASGADEPVGMDSRGPERVTLGGWLPSGQTGAGPFARPRRGQSLRASACVASPNRLGVEGAYGQPGTTGSSPRRRSRMPWERAHGTGSRRRSVRSGAAGGRRLGWSGRKTAEGGAFRSLRGVGFAVGRRWEERSVSIVERGMTVVPRVAAVGRLRVTGRLCAVCMISIASAGEARGMGAKPGQCASGAP